jgi:hypothetical protein
MRAGSLAVALMVGASSSLAQSPCRLEGAWQLVSGTMDGEPYPATWRQIKIITRRHFAFVGAEADRGVKDMKTAADSLRAFRTQFSGGGTYTLQDTIYTERLDYFADPAYLGMSVAFTCRTEGDRLYQTGTVAMLRDGRKVGEVRLAEVWQRIE